MCEFSALLACNCPVGHGEHSNVLLGPVPQMGACLQSKSRMDKFIDGIESNPEKRDGAFPYYLLHKEGELVYGTALLFHGFASKPDQLWRLAQYLFDNGFNIYQPAISNHYLVNPDKNWPQVHAPV